jgi:hypothetical protein
MSDNDLTNAVPDPDLAQEDPAQALRDDETLEKEVDDDFEPEELRDVLPQAKPTEAEGQLP